MLSLQRFQHLPPAADFAFAARRDRRYEWPLIGRDGNGGCGWLRGAAPSSERVCPVSAITTPLLTSSPTLQKAAPPLFARRH